MFVSVKIACVNVIKSSNHIAALVIELHEMCSSDMS